MDSRVRGNDGGGEEKRGWIPACAGMTEGGGNDGGGSQMGGMPLSLPPISAPISALASGGRFGVGCGGLLRQARSPVFCPQLKVQHDGIDRQSDPGDRFHL
ncbi:MAG: hypothetical protein D8M59_09520 [Planctomycetes bacterium]|nr:hypothetical protein [Planctomycetota bacterium]